MNRCHHHVADFGQCELSPKHHGPCTAGVAQVFHNTCPRGVLAPWYPSRKGSRNLLQSVGCPECDLIDAREVLRLANGGPLRPMQVRPGWMHVKARVPNNRIVKWAERLVREAS